MKIIRQIKLALIGISSDFTKESARNILSELDKTFGDLKKYNSHRFVAIFYGKNIKDIRFRSYFSNNNVSYCYVRSNVYKGFKVKTNLNDEDIYMIISWYLKKYYGIGDLVKKNNNEQIYLDL